MRVPRAGGLNVRGGGNDGAKAMLPKLQLQLQLQLQPPAPSPQPPAPSPNQPCFPSTSASPPPAYPSLATTPAPFAPGCWASVALSAETVTRRRGGSSTAPTAM